MYHTPKQGCFKLASELTRVSTAAGRSKDISKLEARRKLPKTLKLYLNNTNNLLSDAAGISKPISLWSSQCEQIYQIFQLKYWLSVTYCVKVSFFTITSKPNMAIPQNRPQKARNLSPVAPSPVMRDHPGLGPSALYCTATKACARVHCTALKNAIGCNKNILHCTTLDFAQF